MSPESVLTTHPSQKSELLIMKEILFQDNKAEDLPYCWNGCFITFKHLTTQYIPNHCVIYLRFMYKHFKLHSKRLFRKLCINSPRLSIDTTCELYSNRLCCGSWGQKAKLQMLIEPWSLLNSRRSFPCWWHPSSFGLWHITAISDTTFTSAFLLPLLSFIRILLLDF